MAKAKREELEERAEAAGVNPAEYGNEADLEADVEAAEAEGDQGGGGEGEAGVQPLTEEDIPESGR